MTAQLGRFVLRDLAPWDATALFALTGCRKTTEYMGFKTHKSIAETLDLILTYRKSATKFQGVFLADALVGVIGFEIRAHQAAVLIMFRSEWSARGAGRELSVPFVEWIFTHPEIWRVQAHCHVDNTPVQRVLERMGAVREGRLRRFEVFPNISDEPQDVFVYSIVRQ